MRVMSYTISKLPEAGDNIHVLFHFTVREMPKAVHEIRDCKKKTQTLRGEKKMKK
jgi:hypothetical protein